MQGELLAPSAPPPAITVFSFPPDKGNVGSAAYLDVFGSGQGGEWPARHPENWAALRCCDIVALGILKYCLSDGITHGMLLLPNTCLPKWATGRDF